MKRFRLSTGSQSGVNCASYPGGMDLAYPFSGSWLVQNSPANRIPSHGTAVFASSYAIDFTPVDARGVSAPIRAASLVRPEPSERFSGFGRSIIAPCSGEVVRVVEDHSDHDAYRGIPSIGYALSQRKRLHDGGWEGLAGNHVVIRASANRFVALCHLQLGSVQVHVGQRVATGERIAACGNSGNSTEPHLHLQVMDAPDPERARAVPVTFDGFLPRNGAIVSPEGNR